MSGLLYSVLFSFFFFSTLFHIYSILILICCIQFFLYSIVSVFYSILFYSILFYSILCLLYCVLFCSILFNVYSMLYHIYSILTLICCIQLFYTLLLV